MLQHDRLLRVLVVAIIPFGLGCRGKTAADHVKLAENYVAQKQYGEAVIEYRAALQQDAQLGLPRLQLADLYAQRGDLQNAYREYIRAADVLPDNTDAQLKGGAMLLLANRFAEAKTRAENVLRKEPRNSGALILLGNALAGLNDTTGALERLNEAIDADPGSGMAYSNLGALQLARGDRQLAEASFKKAISANPKSMGARVALASFYRSQSRAADAETTLKDAIAVDPRSVQINSALAELYVLTGRPLQAEGPLKTIVEVTQTPESEFALAQYYVRTGRQTEAVPVLRKLSGTKEASSLAKVRLAAIDYKDGKAADAHKALDEILRAEPGNRPALLLKGQFLALEKKFSAALGFLKSAAAAEPARAAEPQLLIAKIYLAQEQFKDAEDAYRQVLVLDPRSVPAQLSLSRLYTARGDKRAAVEFARAAVASAPNYVEAHLILVSALVTAGDTKEAENEIRMLNERLPSSAGVDVNLGLLALSRNDKEGARAAFAKALALDPHSMEALAGIVGLDVDKKDRSAAVNRIEARLRETPNDGAGWYLAAQTYFGLKDLPHAEEALRKTIELDPSNLEAFGLLGSVYGAQGKMDEARKQFETWAARDPHSVGAQTMVALLFERQGKAAEARKVYDKVLQIDPHAVVAANNLAWMYAESGDNLDVALQLAQGAAAQMPGEPNFSDTMGWIYYKKDLPDQAMPPILQATRRSPNNPVFQFHLGMIYAKQGEDAKAIASLKKALALDPRFDGAAEAQRIVQQLDIH